MPRVQVRRRCQLRRLARDREGRARPHRDQPRRARVVGGVVRGADHIGGDAQGVGRRRRGLRVRVHRRTAHPRIGGGAGQAVPHRARHQDPEAGGGRGLVHQPGGVRRRTDDTAAQGLRRGLQGGGDRTPQGRADVRAGVEGEDYGFRQVAGGARADRGGGADTRGRQAGRGEHRIPMRPAPVDIVGVRGGGHTPGYFLRVREHIQGRDRRRPRALPQAAVHTARFGGISVEGGVDRGHAARRWR